MADLEAAVLPVEDQPTRSFSAKELCNKLITSLKDPMFLVILGFLYFMVFSFGPHEINGISKAHANLYRRLADFLHLLSFFVMLVKLCTSAYPLLFPRSRSVIFPKTFDLFLFCL